MFVLNALLIVIFIKDLEADKDHPGGGGDYDDSTKMNNQDVSIINDC